jgi:type IV pilus assembly protein PilZ
MTETGERRNWLRLDKVFPVLIESPHAGFMNCVARNISPGGLFLETRAPLPLGSPLRIYFALPQSEVGISATGQVKNHYFLNYASLVGVAAVTGMGVRFTSFDDQGEERLENRLRSAQVFH